ncbi:unnamed protein product, partial [Didymodactylos carnosus]
MYPNFYNLNERINRLLPDAHVRYHCTIDDDDDDQQISSPLFHPDILPKISNQIQSLTLIQCNNGLGKYPLLQTIFTNLHLMSIHNLSSIAMQDLFISLKYGHFQVSFPNLQRLILRSES